MKRALLSVWDKTGLADFARGLVELGYELVSTGGTARTLSQAGLPVLTVAEVTGFPEILDGRVKTLHPAIHAGILARRTPAHLGELHQQKIAPMDMVVVNLYPFEATIAKPNVSLDEAIEQIDIGGVTLLRAAAKNHDYVIVVSDPRDYDGILAELRQHGLVSLATRRRLAIQAFRRTAHYEAAIASYLERKLGSGESAFPSLLQVSLPKLEDLRYGENPHQRAAIYGTSPLGGRLLSGEPLSYNNLLDMDAAWRTASDFAEPTIAIIKHNTPCGVASDDSLAAAFEKALASDPVSAFGGIIAANRPLDEQAVAAWGDLMVDCVVAPGYTPGALELLSKRRRCRVLEIPDLGGFENPSGLSNWEVRSVRGGLLLQERDALAEDESAWRVVTERAPTAAERESLRFAWRVAKHVKSNAIVLCQGYATVGIGAGQMSRVDSVKLAIMKAGPRAAGAVLASDAFFPFADGVEEAAKAGVIAVIEPGGSVRDAEVIAAANAHGLAMLFTGTRHFRH
mgnify:CR=1 FL=1